MVLPVVIAILGTLVGVSILDHAPALPFVKKDKIVVVDEAPVPSKHKKVFLI